MSTLRLYVTRTLLALGLLVAAAGAAEAGPPLICHAFDAGSAPLLPWAKGQSWDSPDTSYDVTRLTADTLRLLSADAPVLARMENMRRATIYAARNRAAAGDLMSAVMKRAQASSGSNDPLAWFDAGYLVESYRQASHIYKWDMLQPAERSAWKLRTEPVGVDGYAMVTKALRLAGPNPEMEFAASLMKDGATAAEHRRRAVAGASAGSLLAKNLANQ
jgi:hypothetical protein